MKLRHFVAVTAAAIFAAFVAQSTMASGSREQAAGSANLVGKIEGPEVVLDRAQYPKTFHEAPDLAKLVQEGKLPPVKDRIGEDPMVIKPLHEIGKYGGTLRNGFTGLGDNFAGVRLAGHDTVLQLDYTAQRVLPGIAKGWEFAPDGRSLTLYLRKGMKWSDGQPLTADDFMFWYNNMIMNKELTSLLPGEMTIAGKPVVMEKIDDTTVKYSFAAPYYFFLQMLIQRSPGDGTAYYGTRFQGGYAPAHYLKQFHPDFVPKDELAQKAKAAGFSSWVELFRSKINWALNTELPVVTAWKLVTPANTTTWVLERNPYSIWVDTAGNQLPYIDKVVLTLAENMEVLNLRAIAGDYDFQARNIQLAKLPVLIQNQTKGDYKVRLDPADNGSDMFLKVNLDYKKDPEIGKWLANVDFRRALSMGIDRAQINESLWLGMGTPGSPIPSPSNPYFPGQEYRTLWHTRDVAKANALLDKIGLSAKDSDGYRLRTDGKGRLSIDLMTIGGSFVDFTAAAEMIKQQLKDIGINLLVSEVERSLANTRMLANEAQLFAWSNDTSESLFTTNHHVLPNELNGFVPHPQFAKWYLSDGKTGDAPPQPMQDALKMFKEGQAGTDEQRVTLGKKIWALAVDNVWDIGIVGLSPALIGVRVVKNGLGNTPDRQYNSNITRTPGSSIPEQFYWK